MQVFTRYVRRWEDNIKRDLKETGWEGGFFFDTVRLVQTAGNLTSWDDAGFLRNTPIHGIWAVVTKRRFLVQRDKTRMKRADRYSWPDWRCGRCWVPTLFKVIRLSSAASAKDNPCFYEVSRSLNRSKHCNTVFLTPYIFRMKSLWIANM